MYIYAGIDEAGYGPLLGPLVVGRFVIALPDLPHDAKPPELWKALDKAVCRTLTGRKGRIAVNDSKKVHTPASGIAHLERGVLAFASLAGHTPVTLDALLSCAGETCHTSADLPLWYQPAAHHPWATLPRAITSDELAIASNMLRTTAAKAGVHTDDLAAHIVFENQFNHMVAATRSKAAVSFTFVASHLRAIYDKHGHHHPHVAVDRQSGRTHYRQLIAQTFPEATIAILAETERNSAYRLHDPNAGRSMTISFMVEAEQQHMPVALASMLSKYLRELLMARFNAWFNHHWPHIKPTAGYATDGRRFINDITPLLPTLDLTPAQLCRIA